MHCHVKMLDTNAPFDVLVKNKTFPEHYTIHEECLSKVDIAQEGISDLKDVKLELVQVSWVTKNQLLRSMIFLEVQYLEVT